MKRMLAALALSAALMLPGLAQAQGMYIAPKFLMTIQDTGRVERSHSLSGSDVSDYSQFTLGGALAAGFDFYPQFGAPLRAELEFALRGNSESSWTGGRFDKVKGTWNNTTLFANLFWDFHNSTAFTPYVGGGLGMAFNYTGYDIKVGGNRYSADDRSTNFAWNVGAGVAYSFNENFAIDASYRFVGLGYNEVSTTGNNGQKYEIGNQPYNNEFAVGLRYSF
ncbi:MAG: outer membrane beta-barrel protein [Desulfovibrio sp.]|nr:outer membrane beta-barrel protein [Desulfovibrio sp.]